MIQLLIQVAISLLIGLVFLLGMVRIRINQVHSVQAAIYDAGHNIAGAIMIAAVLICLVLL
ncbi:MAG: hypothetical protein EOQ44_25195 [Mesorhizobium sp.]|uniref:hypothetical protein n=1 Tax=Mesorhizobium sp. TaxID=1871066 RepID=UPI000FE94468|nr:hypothetical protein [Mesorhizobium sp.]RWB40442.1 MAG: hypothetical protein EOQ44_25195 [Mesorhizobium sp.]